MKPKLPNLFASKHLLVSKPLLRFFLLVFILMNTSAFAQNYVDLLAVGTVYSPNNAEKGSRNRIDITEPFVNIKLPLVLKNKDIFLAGVNFNSLSFNKYYEPLFPDYYTGITLLLGYTKTWNDRLQTMLLALPRVASDFKDISGKDFQMGGILLFTFKKNDHFKYKLGAYYNQEFFGPLVIPIFGLDWKYSEKLRIFGNMPINLTIERKLTERFSTGFFFQAINTSYRLGQQYNNRYLHKISQDVSLYLDTYIMPGLVFNLKAGYSLGRSFGFYDEGDKHPFRTMLYAVGDRNKPQNNAIKDGLLLEAKLSTRVFVK